MLDFVPHKLSHILTTFITLVVSPAWYFELIIVKFWPLPKMFWFAMPLNIDRKILPTLPVTPGT